MNGLYRLSPIGSLPIFFLIGLVVLILLLIPLLIVGIAGAAFSRLGFSWIEAVAVILLMVLGSFVNIPLWTFQRNETGTVPATPVVFDAFTGEPVHDGQLNAELSVNLGGAVVPLIVSGILLAEVQRQTGELLLLQAGTALVIVALVTRYFTTIIPGHGIRAPLVLPSVSALALGLMIAGGTGLSAAVVAFAGGTGGILLGAGVFTIPAIKTSSVNRISVGGAGMFGAVVLCGLLSTLIA